ncbi:MAG: LytTR family DNA-binding domain-containing protein [Caulobacter sp.]|nr:LytTR family DNA-binding domain-containing protein [Caulobacter sp.]
MNAPSVLVVDDEPLARRRAVRLLRQLVDVGSIQEAGDIEQARSILDAASIDVLLLDIQMPGGSGFDLLETLSSPPGAVVFVTAFDDQALRAFEAQATDYITKPIDPGRLQAAFRRAMNVVHARANLDRISELAETVKALRRSGAGRPRGLSEFWVKVRNDYVRLPAAGISHFQADRDYVQIHAASGTYLHHESLASLERRLDDEEFVRVHRSTIVRRDHIVRIKTNPLSSMIAVLADGSEIRVGRTYASTVRSRLAKPG